MQITLLIIHHLFLLVFPFEDNLLYQNQAWVTLLPKYQYHEQLIQGCHATHKSCPKHNGP
jgi:hypothetical protein